jgi:hypothetical protein
MIKPDFQFLYAMYHKIQLTSLYVGPLLSLVELVKISVYRQTQGVLWYVWVAFALMSIGWIIWGIWNHNVAIIVNNLINFAICCGIIAILIV